MELKATYSFKKFVDKLSDKKAKAKLIAALDVYKDFDNPGNAKTLRNGVMEMRIAVGKGYRAYFFEAGGKAFFLGGGDKSNVRKQDRDIAAAIKLSTALKKSPDLVKSETMSMEQVLSPHRT